MSFSSSSSSSSSSSEQMLATPLALGISSSLIVDSPVPARLRLTIPAGCGPGLALLWLQFCDKPSAFRTDLAAPREGIDVFTDFPPGMAW